MLILQGLLALTRQWKNVLYMPVETSFKSKKKVQPYTVTFAIPKEDSVENFQASLRYFLWQASDFHIDRPSSSLIILSC